MSVALACVWTPRGELPRLLRLHSTIRQIYPQIVAAVHLDADSEIYAGLESLAVPYVTYDNWSGRHAVLRLALAKTTSSHLHYLDMDRMLRWVETRPDELARTAEAIQHTDCLITGRTEAAFATHPQCMLQTEWLPNRFFSHWFGREMDFGAGSRGLSRRAAEFIHAHDPDGPALNMDVGWAVLLKRAGFTWDYVAVDGLDYESADQYQAQAATAEAQRQLAEAYDADPRNWALRVSVAQGMTRAGLDMMNRTLSDER